MLQFYQKMISDKTRAYQPINNSWHKGSYLPFYIGISPGSHHPSTCSHTQQHTPFWARSTGPIGGFPPSPTAPVTPCSTPFSWQAAVGWSLAAVLHKGCIVCGQRNCYTGSAGGASPLSAAAVSKEPHSSHALITQLSGQTRAADVRLEQRMHSLLHLHFFQQNQTTYFCPLPLFKVCRCIKCHNLGLALEQASFCLFEWAVCSPTICFLLAPGRAGHVKPSLEAAAQCLSGQQHQSLDDPSPPAFTRRAGLKNPKVKQPT